MNDYNKFIEKLYKNQDLKYREFHKRLILSENLIGVRTPILKDIAKSISKNNYMKFISDNTHNLYEETLVHGLLIGYIKEDFKNIIKLLEDFTPYIDNWAVCDITVANLKIFKEYKKEGLKEIKKYIKSESVWVNRFGYVLLLNYYICDEYIDEIFNLCRKYKDFYYVKISIAWLLSMCYTKYREKTLMFLKSSVLDYWTYSKTIQKIIESNRVSADEKKKLKGMKKYEIYGYS